MPKPRSLRGGAANFSVRSRLGLQVPKCGTDGNLDTCVPIHGNLLQVLLV